MNRFLLVRVAILWNNHLYFVIHIPGIPSIRGVSLAAVSCEEDQDRVVFFNTWIGLEFSKRVDNVCALGVCVSQEADVRIWNFQGHG